MVRNVDYDSRRRAVLAATINKYIDEATPVASEDLAEDFDLSPATIRHIMAELEKDGYITHPYTSGGRLPTTRGYRYYVDFLLAQMELLEAEKEHIVNEYKKEIRRLEDALEKTSGVISMITHYAGIVSFVDWQDRIFYQGISQILEHPEFKDYAHLRRIVNLIEEKEWLLDIINRDFKEKVKVYIGDELACPGMEDCALVVSSYKLKNKSLGRLAVLGPQRMEYGHTIPALEYISVVLSEVLEKI